MGIDNQFYNKISTSLNDIEKKLNDKKANQSMIEDNREDIEDLNRRLIKISEILKNSPQLSQHAFTTLTTWVTQLDLTLKSISKTFSKPNLNFLMDKPKSEISRKMTNEGEEDHITPLLDDISKLNEDKKETSLLINSLSVVTKKIFYKEVQSYYKDIIVDGNNVDSEVLDLLFLNPEDPQANKQIVSRVKLQINEELKKLGVDDVIEQPYVPQFQTVRTLTDQERRAMYDKIPKPASKMEKPKLKEIYEVMLKTENLEEMEKLESKIEHDEDQNIFYVPLARKIFAIPENEEVSERNIRDAGKAFFKKEVKVEDCKEVLKKILETFDK